MTRTQRSLTDQDRPQETTFTVSVHAGAFHFEWCGYADNTSDALNQALTGWEQTFTEETAQ